MCVCVSRASRVESPQPVGMHPDLVSHDLLWPSVHERGKPQGLADPHVSSLDESGAHMPARTHTTHIPSYRVTLGSHTIGGVTSNACFLVRKHLTTVFPDMRHVVTCNVVLARMYQASFFFSAGWLKHLAAGRQHLLFGFLNG